MGQYFSGHILDEYKKCIASYQSTPISDIMLSFKEEDEEVPEEEPDEIPLALIREHQRVIVCGVIAAKTMKNTKNGDMMAFITLEDRTAEIEGIIFPKVLQKHGELIYQDSAVAVSGEVTKREEEPPKLLVSYIAPLLTDSAFSENHRAKAMPSAAPMSPQRTAKTLYIKVPAVREADEDYRRLRALIEIYVSDHAESKVSFYDTETGKYHPQSFRIDVTEGLLSELRRRLSEENVVIR